MRDVLSMQGEVAGAIAKQIQLNVTPREQQALARPRPVEPVAYELYLQGRYFWSKRTANDVRKALAFYRQALEKDPNSALAYSGIAESYMTLGPTLQVLPPQQAVTDAKAAATRAMELDPELAEPHVTLSQISLINDWDWPKAESEIKKAVELNPGSSAAHHWYGLFLGYQGKAAEARRQILQARESDPLSPILQANVGWTYYIEGDYEHAKQELEKTQRANPDFWVAPWGLGSTYVQLDQLPKAITELERAVKLSGRAPGALSSVAYAYARAGESAKAKAVLSELKSSAGKNHVSSWDVAIVYAGLNDRHQTVIWLERAAAEHSQSLPGLKVEPWFSGLRNDPRFQQLMRKIKLV
jgi:Flp pilus assembly protein TadD